MTAAGSTARASARKPFRFGRRPAIMGPPVVSATDRALPMDSPRPAPGPPRQPPADGIDAASTIELLALVKENQSEEAVNVLFGRYLPRITRWARGRLPRYARNMLDTDDLVQDTVFQTLKRLQSFEVRHEGALQGYLRTAVVNRIRDEVRRATRHPGAQSLHEDGHVDAAASPLEEAIGGQAVARYERAMEKLSRGRAPGHRAARRAAAARTPRSPKRCESPARMPRAWRSPARSCGSPRKWAMKGDVARSSTSPRRSPTGSPSTGRRPSAQRRRRARARADRAAEDHRLDWRRPSQHRRCRGAAGRRRLHARCPRPRRRPHPPGGRVAACRRAHAAAGSPSIGDPASTGVRWGRLLLQERVGAGVYGEVYRAFDESLRRDVAVKLLRASGRSADLLAAKVLNEGRLLARVRHRNVVTVHGVDTHDGRVGLWMEFIRGNTLEQLLERQGPFGGREASLLGQDLCRALAAVHAAGLVHRDVKAQNVIREEGGRARADGLRHRPPARGRRSRARPRRSPARRSISRRKCSPAPTPRRRATSTASASCSSISSPARIPTSRARWPSCGGCTSRGERKRLHDLRPDLSEGFVQVVERALESDPAERYASVGAMQRGLTHALGLESGLMPPVTLAAIAADADAALRGSGTLSSTGTAPRPVVRASRWKVWLPLLIAAALAAGVGRVADPRLVDGARVAGRAGAAGLARRRALRSGLVGRSRARRRHRRGRHGARPAAARRPRRRRSRPPPRRRRRAAEAVLTRHQVDGAGPRHRDVERRPGSRPRHRAARRRRRPRVRRRRSSARSSGPPSCRGSSPTRWCAGSASDARAKIRRGCRAPTTRHRPSSRPTCAADRRCGTCPR